MFPTFLSLYWGLPFLITPERGKWEKGILQKWMRHRGFCTLGFKLDHLQPVEPILSQGLPFLITPTTCINYVGYAAKYIVQ